MILNLTSATIFTHSCFVGKFQLATSYRWLYSLASKGSGKTPSLTSYRKGQNTCQTQEMCLVLSKGPNYLLNSRDVPGPKGKVQIICPTYEMCLVLQETSNYLSNLRDVPGNDAWKETWICTSYRNLKLRMTVGRDSDAPFSQIAWNHQGWLQIS